MNKMIVNYYIFVMIMLKGIHNHVRSTNVVIVVRDDGQIPRTKSSL